MGRYQLKSIKSILLYGFLIWLIPFIVSIVIFPIHDSNRVLFESIMPVTITIVVLFFSMLYFGKIEEDYLNEGITMGIIWFVISIAIDLFMFLPESPMQMTFAEYMMDIGITYVIILVIPVLIGYLLEQKAERIH
ncbi:MAG: hypothetical protein JSV09_00990 [Thermoplasmata archaeon]|nr:MAG: hypothetical protein JSV09_00990 [Thermoplasmata archaeon]